jgi:hypothetical protein
MLTGSPSTTSSKSAWIHIHHACPNATSWNLWQKACSLWSMNNTLRHPLGDWLKPAHQLRRQWPAYYNHSSGELYIHTEKGFTRCVQTDPIRFSTISHVEWSPTSESYPVSARKTINGEAWIPTIPSLPVPANPPLIPSTFDKYLSGLASWEVELFLELSMAVD